MTSYDTRRTPDYSPLVVHFTRDKVFSNPTLVRANHPVFQFRELSAFERVVSILQRRTIYATPMQFLPNHAPAVCFTECIWDALTRMAGNYSPYGVVFNKRVIFKKGGGPALYMRGDIVKTLGRSLPAPIEPFVAPFDPKAVLTKGAWPLDYLTEREWRLPNDLAFEYTDVEYVIVDTIGDAHNIVKQVGADHLREGQVIPMEVYKTIRTAWRSD